MITGLPGYLRYILALDPLRDDARYRKLVADAGF